MGKFLENGLPFGTLVTAKDDDSVVEQLRGKILSVQGPLHYSDKFGSSGYMCKLEHSNKLEFWFCREELIVFRSYPVTLQNWVRNKIDRLFDPNETILYDLAYEQNKPEGKPYG